MADIDIFSVHSSMIDDAWPAIKPYIEKAMPYANGEFCAEDVHEMIRAGSVIPVVMSYRAEIMAVVTLEVSQKPGKKIMCLMTAGGTDLEHWLDEFMDVATELAIEQGCRSIYVNGRAGWLRKLKRHGFQKSYTVLSKELN